MPTPSVFRTGVRCLTVGGLLGLSACGQAPPAVPTTQPVGAPLAPPPAQPRLSKAAADSATQTAVRFYAWYRRHREQANGFQFLASASDADTTQRAGVSFTQVNQFLRLLRSSRCVSAAYLNHWDAYFHQQADELADVSSDGDIVAGFAFELVLDSQEGDHYLEQMGTAPKQVRCLAPGQAVVTADFAPRAEHPDKKQFYLRRYPSGWLIDSIR